MIFNEQQKQSILTFCSDLVRTGEFSGEEKETAQCVRRKMESLGYDEIHTDRYGSVLGVLKGKHPGPTLLFDGHMDVVPVREEGMWDFNPFGGDLSEGCIRGRGTTDMKGALAAMVCAPAFLEREEIYGKVIVSASVAEELMIGSALDHILSTCRADAVIIGEPTGLKLGHAEKGRATIEMICRGKVAHSSRPDLGDNAVYRMMEAVSRIREIPRRSDPLLGEEVIELVEISSLPSPGNGSIPGSCRALWECRLLPGETKEEFLDRWTSALKGIGRTELRVAGYELATYTKEILKLDDFLKGWTTLEEGFRNLVSAAVSDCGRNPEYYAAPFGCNALISAGAKSIPTVIIGPGDIAMAHKPNEYLRIDELLEAAGIYSVICQKMAEYKVPE